MQDAWLRCNALLAPASARAGVVSQHGHGLGSWPRACSLIPAPEAAGTLLPWISPCSSGFPAARSHCARGEQCSGCESSPPTGTALPVHVEAWCSALLCSCSEGFSLTGQGDVGAVVPGCAEPPQQARGGGALEGGGAETSPGSVCQMLQSLPEGRGVEMVSNRSSGKEIAGE